MASSLLRADGRVDVTTEDGHTVAMTIDPPPTASYVAGRSAGGGAGNYKLALLRSDGSVDLLCKGRATKTITPPAGLSYVGTSPGLAFLDPQLYLLRSDGAVDELGWGSIDAKGFARSERSAASAASLGRASPSSAELQEPRSDLAQGARVCSKGLARSAGVCRPLSPCKGSRRMTSSPQPCPTCAAPHGSAAWLKLCNIRPTLGHL